jgi:3-hydroxyisobutyrate dehydrogenase-like beta-hydroxyacid dehydrogenase
MSRAGFVGLGVMGGPMAGHLAAAGYETVVWNRTPGKAQLALDSGATEAQSIQDLAAECSVIFLCVSKTEDVKSCLEEIKKSAAPGTLIVDHSTISPVGAKEIHTDLNASGFRFIDAPITGGSMGAQKGALTIFCGGTQADFDEALPYLQSYAKTAARVGEAGAGEMMKMANQIAVAGTLTGVCEALSLAEKAGLDLDQTRKLLGSGAAGSWSMDNYAPKILDRDWTPGFSIKNQRKDFGYCREAAQLLEMDIPLTELTDKLLKILDEEGHSEWTTAAMYEVYERNLTE